MKQYPVDRRQQVLRAIDAGLTLADAAVQFGVSPSTIGSWQRRQREQGCVTPSPRPGRPPRIGPAEHGVLLAQVHTHPEATVAEHRARWAADHRVRVSIGTMHRALKRVGWNGAARRSRERL